MTPEKQRVAIAEACGWRIERRDITGYSVWEPGAEVPAQLTNNLENKLPNYPNDLNAMHEAEGMLLAKCGNDPQDDLWVDYLANLLMAAPLCLREHATAAQRAEAFLKTIGKWEDSQ